MKARYLTFILPSCRKGLPGLLLTIAFVLIAFIASVVPTHAEPHRNMVNLRGNRVLVPLEVPPKEDYVFQRFISVDNEFIVFLYRDPRFHHAVDYSETYDLRGELLEIAWYKPAEGLKRARDISLDTPQAETPARVLEIIYDSREHDRSSETVAEDGLQLE